MLNSKTNPAIARPGQPAEQIATGDPQDQAQPAITTRVVAMTHPGGAGKSFAALLAYEALLSALPPGQRPRTVELESTDRKFAALLEGHGAQVDLQLRLPGQAEQRQDRAALLHAVAPLLDALEDTAPLVADVGAGVADSVVGLMMDSGHAARVNGGEGIVFLVPALAGDLVHARAAQRVLAGLAEAYPQSRLIAVLSAAPGNAWQAREAEKLLLGDVEHLVDAVLAIPQDGSVLTTAAYARALVPHGVLRRGVSVTTLAKQLGLSPVEVAADAAWHARWYDGVLAGMCAALGLPAPKPMPLPMAAVQAARAPRQPLRPGQA